MERPFNFLYPSKTLPFIMAPTMPHQTSPYFPLSKEQRLLNSKEEVMHFWQQAWQEEQRLFFTQANMALPDLSTENTDFDSVFEAMLSQRDRIKETQQLVDWA